jgi:hypothetical protein
MRREVHPWNVIKVMLVHFSHLSDIQQFLRQRHYHHARSDRPLIVYSMLCPLE